MRLFTNKQDRALRFVARPDGIIEHKPAEHRDHGCGNIRRHGRHIDDRDWFAIGRQAENLTDEIGHRVADQHAREHEVIPRISLQLVNFSFEPHEWRGRCRFVQFTHFVLDNVGQIGQQIGDRRVNGQFANGFGNAVFGACL